MSEQKFRVKYGLAVGDNTTETAATIDGTTGDIVTAGDIQLGGNTIKKSGGTPVIEFSGTNLVTTAGDISIGGNTIRDNANTAAIELGGANVEVVGELTVTGNKIRSSGGAAFPLGDIAVQLSGSNVEVVGDLTVTGNDIKSSGGTTAITLSGTDATVAGDLAVNGGDITTTAATASVFNTNATTVNAFGAGLNVNIGNSAGTVTIPGNLTVQGTTTTIDTTNLNVEDNIITLNYGFTGTPPTSLRSGIEIERGTDPNVTWQWNELNKWWEPEGGTGSTEQNIWAGGGIIAGTNLATNGTQLTFNNDDGAGADTYINVNRGSGTLATIRWNETTDRWQTSVDGTNYLNIPNQNLDTTSDVDFRTVETSRGIAASGAALGVNGETTTFQLLAADGTVSGGSTISGFITENVTAGFGSSVSIVDHGQNRSGGTATTGGAPVVNLSSTRGTAVAPTASSTNDLIGAVQFGGYDGTRNLSQNINGFSVQLLGLANQTYANNGTYTTQAGATTILRSQPSNLRLTSASRQNILLAAYTGGTTNTPPTMGLNFNSNTMTVQYDTAGNAINGHGRQDVSWWHPTHSIFGVPSQSTANADNSTLPGSNIITFNTSRQSGWSGRRDLVESGDTLAQIRVFGQTTNNSTGNGAQAGTIDFSAAETFSTTNRGSTFTVQTGEIGTNTLSNRIVLDNNNFTISTTKTTFRTPGGNTTYGGEISQKVGIRNGATAYDRTTELSVTALTADGTASATYETKTNRYDGTNYAATVSGDQLGQFTFVGNYGTSTTPLSVNAAAALRVTAAENFTATASGTNVRLSVNKIGANTSVDVINANSSSASLRSDVFTFADSTGTNIIGSKINYNRVYGQWQNLNTITPAANNTAYAFALPTIDYANVANVASTSQITPGALGFYKMQFSVQVLNTDNASEHTAYFWWKKNGVDVPGSMGRLTVPRGAVGGELLAGWDNMVQVTTITDYWELMYAVEDVAITFPFYAATAFGPSTASLFVTLVPIGA